MRVRLRAAALSCLGLLAACRTGQNYPGAVGPRYAGAPPPAAAPALPRGDTLRLVTFNVQFARRVDAAAELLASHPELRGADVVLLQEMDAPGTRRVAEALGLGYVYYPAIAHNRTGRDFGNAVLSRWPIVEDAKIVLPHPSRYARTQRTATAATLRVGDVRVRVYSTHLGTLADVGPGARRDQLRAVLADAAQHPLVVIGGDLNDAAVGRVAQDAGYAWPTERGPRTTRLGRWDHILLKGLQSPDSAAAGTVLDTRGTSDHRPVWAVALLPQVFVAEGAVR
ncbi:MAG TPA: endonuclease/exonuclease/phosphatase family protein [Longimicrobiaceae bacterium]|nr:endonuclease/exonuclease/phosphatase family protein [Longimicrobiaceae bacterium]